MFRFVIRFIGKFQILAIATILAVACTNSSKEATATAKAFLQAYYVDLDFETAIRLSSNLSHNAITEHAELSILNPYAKEETPTIIFKTIELEPNSAMCIYTCNMVERKLPLRKFNGKWLVDLGGSTVETFGLGDLSQLAQDKSGFASASSGEIKYKKRRTPSNNN